MIYIDGRLIEQKHFPDHTLSVRLGDYDKRGLVIRWKYDGDEECMVLWNIVHHIRSHTPETEIVLELPYIPNARMDRVKNDDEIFTLKWFAEFINYLDFERVVVHDPHSNVAIALIDRVVVRGVDDDVVHVITQIGDDQIVLCYPDEGATKKYAEQLQPFPYVFGIKHRDWRTGKIESLTLNNAEIVRGKAVLIVDDICSRGGTFMHTAQALKDAGAGDVYLYVTHCENTIFDGEVIKSDLIERVFTTDSIYRGKDAKIIVLRKE